MELFRDLRCPPPPNKFDSRTLRTPAMGAQTGSESLGANFGSLPFKTPAPANLTSARFLRILLRIEGQPRVELD
jgi:hypothetical protein